MFTGGEYCNRDTPNHLTQSVVKYETCLIEESADDYIPTGGSALESANSELESANSSTNSNADPPKISVWVRALMLLV